MAYAALISLKQTTKLLLNSFHVFIDPHLRPRIEFVCNQLVPSIHEFLKKNSSFESCYCSSSLRLMAKMDVRMREAVCKFEDVLETHVSNQLLSGEISSFYGDEIEDEIDYLTEVVHKMEKDYKKVNSIIEYIGIRGNEEDIAIWKEIFQDEIRELEDLSNRLLLEYESPRDTIDDLLENIDEYKTHSSSSFIDDVESVASKPKFGRINSKMVGLHDQLSELKERLMDRTAFTSQVVPIVGMVGIGKTTLAKRVYEDPSIVDHFECRVWVTIGPKYNTAELFRCILAQTNTKFDLRVLKYDELARHVSTCLKGKRYLIVMDDVWNTGIWDILCCKIPSEPGSRIMLTTRLEKVSNYTLRWSTMYRILKMRFLNEEESWYLFCDKIFGKDTKCPSELEKVGKKIVQNCEGLPLAIVTIGDHLSKAKKTLDYWNRVAEKKINVFDSINMLLYSDYDKLSQNLQPCFLYIGGFPQDLAIPASKLINLWYAEGFIEHNPTKTMEDVGMEYLEDLVSRSVVLIRKHSSKGRIKTCGIHYIFQHLCITESEKNKLFYVLNSCPSSSTESIKDHRRICIHNNVSLGMKDVYDLMESVLSTTVRSLLCTGPYHQYPVKLCLGLRLLRIMDALTIRFYTFPIEVLKLPQLRYLAITYTGKLPASISKLWNLQYLIVKQHFTIKPKGVRSYLPIEIWAMKELRHIQVTGFDMPDPPCGAVLPNLSTLSDVNAQSCTKEVFEGIPNLRKLGVQIVLGLDNDVDENLCFFHQIAHLQQLESLKCTVVNPLSRSNHFVNQDINWPSGLKKLSLSGFGFPWKYMSKIGEQLANLEVLKIRCNAFQGQKWKTTADRFPKLKYLLIEDTDLEYLELDGNVFKELEHLIMRNCYKLKKTPLIMDNTVFELVDCNPSVERLEPVKCNQLKRAQSFKLQKRFQMKMAQMKMAQIGESNPN